MTTDRSLLTEPIPRLVRSIALPASTGYIFNTMYNMVDTWFAGRISTDALAALGLSFPIFFVVIAVSSGLSTGVSSLLANVIGAGRPDEAKRLATQSVTFTVIASLLVTMAGVALAKPAFLWMGAAPGPARLGAQYMTVIFAGCFFFNLSHVFNAFLVARGDTHTYRNVLMAGVALNAVLDPWFIHGGFGLPAMGFKGIALSTVLIQAMACLYLYRCALRRGAMEPWSPASLKLTRGAAADLLRQSGPATVNMMTIGLGILILTFFVNEHGTGAVAAYGIAVRIEQLVLLPAIGLNMAVLSIAGQNNGAGQLVRVRETIRVALRFGLYVLAPGILLLVVWPGRAMALFTADPQVVGTGTGYLRIAGLTLYAYVLLFTLTSLLQAVKRPLYAIWIGLYRQLLAPLVIIYILSRHTGLGIWSVWLSIAFTTWSSALFTVWYTRHIMRRLVLAAHRDRM